MDTRRYAHVVEAVRRTPWAIRPEVLERIIAVLALRASGERYSAEEIAGRIGAGPPARAPRTVGSVAVLPLYGVLFPKASLLGDMSGGTSLGRFRASFREAVASQVVSGIVLDVDSPGGLVDLVPETATEIRQARGRKPIVAVANTEAASAAYWIASQADELVVTPSGNVGSIGVFAAHNDISRAQDMAGVKTTLITAGRYKAEANPFEPLSEEARAAIQRTVDDYYRMFTLDVARGRSVPVEAVRQGYGEGRMLTAQAALTAGMVDRIASLEEVLRGFGVRQAGTRAEREAVEAAAEQAHAIITGLLDAERADAEEAAAEEAAAEEAAADEAGEGTNEERERNARARERVLELYGGGPSVTGGAT